MPYLRSASLIVLVAVLLSILSYGSPKKHDASRDINAIGHRNLGCEKGMGNWYTSEQEKDRGAQLAASLQQSKPVLSDPEITTYLERITQVIAANSDAHFPITVRVIDSEESSAVTLPGGYQFITRGLLLQLQNEGELASALARGIAHTSLCTEARIETRANLAKIATVPLIFTGETSPDSKRGADLAVPLTMLKLQRQFELAADYFGIQYLYKSGYDPEAFIHFVQTVWPEPPPGKAVSITFSSFPPTTERLNALRKEINEILLRRHGAVTNTPEFIRFREHLLTLSPAKPQPGPVPTLLHSDEHQH